MRFATFALLMAATTPAWAQDRPAAIFPTRDVSVTYRATDNQTLTMSWLTNGQLLRVDMPQAQGAAIVDQAKQSVMVVMDAQRMVMELPAGAGGPGGMQIPTAPGANARFTREGTETIAGLQCTNWRYAEGNRSGRACVTNDGVLLRANGGDGAGNAGGITATEVRFGPQDPARFRAPPGYQTMNMQQMMQGLGGGRPPGR